jgi:hypothetical protein
MSPPVWREMAEFREFLWAVWLHWGWLMSGIFGLVVSGASKLFSGGATGKPTGFRRIVDSPILLFACIVAIFLAFFLAWRDQKRIAIDALAKAEDRPSLWAEFQNATLFPSEQINEKTQDFAYAPFYICINAKLGNNGSPTAIQNWRFAIPNYNFITEDAPLSMFTTHSLLSVSFGFGGKTYFSKSDSLAEKIGNHQLLKNTPVSGYLLFPAPPWVIEHLRDDIQTGNPPTCELRYADGQERSIVYTNNFKWNSK